MHRWRNGAALAGAFGLVSAFFTGPLTMAATPSRPGVLAGTHPAMRQILRPGSRGHWVMTLQADLRLLGYRDVGPMDGIFGPRTETALKQFQSRHGFPASGVTSAAVWQDILAGFGLTPLYRGTALKAGAGNGPPSNAPARTAPSGPVLPENFPTGGAPVSEPGLSSPTGGQMGTFAPAVKTIDGRPVLKAYHMVATAYGPSLADNYPYGPTDYFGQPLEDGMVAVDPSVIPLHSVVYVKGYRDNYLPAGGFVGRALDTGGAIQGDRIDIFIRANPTVISDFGIQQVTVYVLGR